MNTAPPSGSSQLPNPEIYEEFLAAYSRHQVRVQAFIRALVPDATQADDVFQATSLVLWRSFSTFDRSREFLPWAIGVARHQVLGHWRTRRRDRHVFNDDLLANLADQAAGMVTGVDARQRALDRCLESLSDRQRDLIRLFYGENRSADAIAISWNRTVHAVYKALKVMRRQLLNCVEQRLAAEAQGGRLP